jgi:hypothetical protein
MEFVPTLAMLALTVKVIDWLRYLRAGDMNGVLTQLAAWVAGVLVVLLVAQTAWSDGIQVGGTNLHVLGFWSLVFYGMSAGSGASLAKDTLKAVDNTNSAAIPVLVPSKTPPRADGPRDVG